MKDFLTGATHGFIGKHLAAALVEKGHQLRLLKVNEWTRIEKAIRSFKPEEIFHLAAYGNHYHQTDIDEMIQANIMRTFVLLRVSNNINYKAFVVIGSSSEYGRKEEPMNETDLLEPNTFYAATKAGATLLSQVWAKQYEKPIVVVRPFSIYGPGEASHRFIPTVIRSCLLGESMSLAKESVHDWLYVADFVDGMLIAATKAKTIGGQIVNFGSGVQTTNQKIVEMIEKICGKKADIREVKSLRTFDTSCWAADVTYAKSLGWNPKVSLLAGLEKTVKYYAQTLNRAKN